MSVLFTRSAHPCLHALERTRRTRFPAVTCLSPSAVRHVSTAYVVRQLTKRTHVLGTLSAAESSPQDFSEPRPLLTHNQCVSLFRTLLNTSSVFPNLTMPAALVVVLQSRKDKTERAPKKAPCVRSRLVRIQGGAWPYTARPHSASSAVKHIHQGHPMRSPKSLIRRVKEIHSQD